MRKRFQSQLAREENPQRQMIFSMTEVVGLLQEGVGHLRWWSYGKVSVAKMGDL